jgi:hypothetical protein
MDYFVVSSGQEEAAMADVQRRVQNRCVSRRDGGRRGISRLLVAFIALLITTSFNAVTPDDQAGSDRTCCQRALALRPVPLPPSAEQDPGGWFVGAIDDVLLSPSADTTSLPFVQKTDWAKLYAQLDARISPNMDEPRGYPSDLGPYFDWLERKAVDRNDTKQALNEVLNVTSGSPEWIERFQKLLDKAQLSGENTAWDACFKFLRIKKDDDWQNCLFKVRKFGHLIYLKTLETAFDPQFVRDGWVRCLIRYAINDVEEGRGLSLYDGRLSVLAEWDDEGYLNIPKRDFDVSCERRVEFQTLEQGKPKTPADKGLAWVDDIRNECDWWSFGAERADATRLMEEYYRDVLCFYPHDKSHQWYMERARQYRLADSEQYNDGFYGTLKGRVWIGEGEDRRPADGAHIVITDPKDNSKWQTDAGPDGTYTIKRALLHAPQDEKGRPRCPQFKITAERQGCRVETIYDGPLTQPKPGAVFEKDLTLRCLNAWDVNYTFTEQMNVTSPQLKASRQYSLKARGRVYFKERKRNDEIYESDSAMIELNDSFNQHITETNYQAPDTHLHGYWTATKNGQVPMRMRLVFNTYSHKYSLFVPAWQGDPVIVKGTYQWNGVPREPDGAREFTCQTVLEELPIEGLLSPEDDASGDIAPRGEPYQEGQSVLSGEYPNVRSIAWSVGCVCCSGNLLTSPPPLPVGAAHGAGIALNPFNAGLTIPSKPWTKSVKWEIRRGK